MSKWHSPRPACRAALNAKGGTRTHTAFRLPAPKTGASASSATFARDCMVPLACPTRRDIPTDTPSSDHASATNRFGSSTQRAGALRIQRPAGRLAARGASRVRTLLHSRRARAATMARRCGGACVGSAASQPVSQSPSAQHRTQTSRLRAGRRPRGEAAIIEEWLSFPLDYASAWRWRARWPERPRCWLRTGLNGVARPATGDQAKPICHRVGRRGATTSRGGCRSAVAPRPWHFAIVCIC